MKKSEVPQEDSVLKSVNMTDLYYVTDEDGNYTTAKSSGWEAKALALDESMELINERVNQAKQDVADGKVSPIVYFMEVNKMDFGILAGFVGMWAYFVKQHAKPNVFRKLSDRKLQKYADAFDITVEELKNFDGK